MKISIIGAGNVGGTTTLRLVQEGLGDIVLIDKLKGLAEAKALDMEDARPILKLNYGICGSDDINKIKDSRIVVITAGLTRKPGMSRQDLLDKNSQILKEICLKIKELAPDSIVVIVTNPLDLMTYLALKITGFAPDRVFGMGISLDAARFANLISKELDMPNSDIEACVIGSHGEGMLVLPRLTKVKGISLEEFLDAQKTESLVDRTLNRGAQIVSLLANGSAYFAPSAAIAAILKSIVKDQKRIIGVCAYLNGEYGLKDICIGVPCRLGKGGIEEIIELDLNRKEKEAFNKSASSIKTFLNSISRY